MKTLRPHQIDAIDMLRSSLRSGKRRPMLQAPVGFGKTLVAATIIRNALAKGNKACFIVDAISLIDQTVRAFWAEGIDDIGVAQGGHPMEDWGRSVTICSVQTLRARNKLPEAGLYLVDEAHSRSKWLLERMKGHPSIWLGLSATPWARGLGNHYDDLLKPATLAQLTPDYNPPITAYGPGDPDLSKVRTMTTGDYDQSQLSKVMRDNVLVADIVDTWKDLGEGRPTFLFCVDRAHAQVMQERFEQAGIGCGYIDGDTPIPERDEVKRRLDAGAIKVVASVGALVKGVDWKIGCVISAAPTKSPMKWVQAVGRGLRKHPEWPDLILIDHAGNILRKGLGLPQNIDFPAMCTAGEREKSKLSEIQDKQPLERKCKGCHFILPLGQRECPRCGFTPPAMTDISEGAGELVRIDGAKTGPKKAEATAFDKEMFYRMAIGWCAEKGKNPNMAAHLVREKYGHWPAKKHGMAPISYTPEFQSWVKARMIRFAKSKGKAA